MSNSSTIVLILAVFGASMVEMVEALTIVVAVGVSRGWRTALAGAGSALTALGALVGIVGPPLVHFVPLDTLRVVVGALLLSLGLSWLRKAMLRASGNKALHDEDAIFEETRRGLGRDRAATGLDRIGFTVSFKGVFLEGIEVVLIVVGLGASQHRLGLAAGVAGGAAILVAGLGALVARQLSEVPENTIKTGVGIMLTSFGLFWVGEGAGVRWPGEDLAIPVFVGIFAAITALGVAGLRAAAPDGFNRPAEVPARAAAIRAPAGADRTAPGPGAGR